MRGIAIDFQFRISLVICCLAARVNVMFRSPITTTRRNTFLSALPYGIGPIAGISTTHTPHFVRVRLTTGSELSTLTQLLVTSHDMLKHRDEDSLV